MSPAEGLFPYAKTSTLDFLTRRKPQEKAEERTGDIVNVELTRNLYKCGMDIDLVKIGHEEKINFKERKVFLERLVDNGNRLARIRKIIQAIRFMTDYSKQARLLTDFTPDVICITFQNLYSHRIQKLFSVNPQEGTLDTRRMKDILNDVKGYSDKIFFGMIPSVLGNEKEIESLLDQMGLHKLTPYEALDQALEYSRNLH